MDPIQPSPSPAELERLAVAYFVSPHGFGHATRSAAVMAALARRRPGVRFEIFTTAPTWIFAETLRDGFRLHETTIDVGLVQTTPLREDLEQTLLALDRFYPLDEATVARLAGQLEASGCRLVVCDIAPLGIAAAHHARLPAVLVENFTWDWIYAAYVGDHPHLGTFIPYLADLFAAADYHIQTEPICRPVEADLVAPPISRRPRLGRSDQRRALGLDPEEQVVLVSMGGLSADHRALARLDRLDPVRFLVPSHVERALATGNRLLIPWHGAGFHPDLIAASDAVVSKLGYSTLAEVYQAGVPFGFVTRDRFPESRPLQSFVSERMPGRPIPSTAFEDGTWIDVVPELLTLSPTSRRGLSGAQGVAEFLARLLDTAR